MRCDALLQYSRVHGPLTRTVGARARTGVELGGDASVLLDVRRVRRHHRHVLVQQVQQQRLPRRLYSIDVTLLVIMQYLLFTVLIDQSRSVAANRI